MSKLILINRFFWPDQSATSLILTDLATALAADYSVTVVTSRKIYHDPLAQLERKEVFNGVEILRLNSARLGRASLLRRAFDYLSFFIHVLVYLLRNIGKNDSLLLMTDPPLLSLVNTGIIRMKGGRVINWLQDVFPEIAIELGAFPSSRIFSGPLLGWRNRTLRSASKNVVISHKTQALLSDQHVPATQFIPNWANGELIRPISHADNVLRQKWSPDNQFLVGYRGIFGLTHSFDELIQAMTLLNVRPEIHFVLIGEVAALDRLLEAVERKQLHNVSFHPCQPHDSLCQSFAAVDLHLVTLKDSMEGLVLPSKIYDVLVAGRPIGFVGDAEEEIEGLIRANEVGFAVNHGEGAHLAKQIQALAADPERLRRMGGNARRLFDREYSKTRAMARWKKLMADVIGKQN